ncbi:hypothetical protein EIP86_011427 [Pleurotus ostreatoroseus]|nr:hypothetical protein EIP86_011427 [Pleurotus ostreatoroseus]
MGQYRLGKFDAFFNELQQLLRKISFWIHKIFDTAIILDITYGMQIQDMNHEYFSLSRIAVAAMDVYRLPGTFWVEFFPWLKLFPTWVPGSTAQRFANRYAPVICTLRDKTFEQVIGDLKKGHVVPSVTQSLIEKLQNIPSDSASYREFEQSARDVTGIAYAGPWQRLFPVWLGF